MEALEIRLDKLLKEYGGKDLSVKETRDTLIRDILGLLAQQEKGGKKNAVIMTEAASMYSPKTDSIPQRPKAI